MNPPDFIIPDFIIPWLDRFYNPLERELLRLLSDEPCKKAQIENHLDKTKVFKEYHSFDHFFKTAWKRGVVRFVDDQKIALQDFHVRFDFWALFEGWKDIPLEIKNKLNEWELDHYISSHGSLVEDLKSGKPRDSHKIYPEYLLLHEVEALFNKISNFYLWPCNCRAMMNNCQKTEFTCIRFSNTRDIGWEISREKALNIVNHANKIGLMQSAEIGLDLQGNITGALCNCCSDCCFPHLLSERMNAQKYWPFTRYFALPPNEDCISCGKCIKRCPFGAISKKKENKKDKLQIPDIDIENCRGCGLCATGCPENAIGMEKFKTSFFESEFQN